MILVAIVPQDAFACLELCKEKFGYYLKTRDGNTYELESCSERWNSAGGITTTCYYS